MCGIAGFLTSESQGLNERHLTAMGDAIVHRGPDASGVYLNEHVGLCHRRLSILDLSEAGNQPMFSDCGNIVIVFNGEIYNFVELKTQLENEGVTFKSTSDTEVIIKLYEKKGIACINDISGMFAFAIWDDNLKQLFMVRDRLGKKPFYYYLDPENPSQFSFASEIKSILTLPNIKRELRLDAAYDFFAYQYVPDPKSIFKHIHKIPPAHYMTIKDGDITLKQYWDVSFKVSEPDSEQVALDELYSIIERSTQRRMISDVPLGAFLSGGVDSSGIVATMSNLSSSPIKTCTIAFDNEKYNEAEFAKSVAEQYKTEHHEFLVHQNVSDTLEHIVSFFDEPFADPSLVPTFFVSELARKEVTVAIAGDGGDEVFAGYEKYTTDFIENKLREKFPKALRENIFPMLAKFFGLIPIRIFKKAKSLLTSLSVTPAMGFYITNSHIDDDQWSKLVKPEIKKQLGNYHPSKITLDFYNNADGSDHLSKILYTDMKTYLTGGILVKVDRMSMANSLEVRAPILDKEVIEFAAKLPSHFKFRDQEKKYALKQIFKPFLSNDILYRKKMGFSVPLADWLRTEIFDIGEKYLIETADGITQIFEHSAVQTMWQQHQSKEYDHSPILWSMLMFEMWYQRYMK